MTNPAELRKESRASLTDKLIAKRAELVDMQRSLHAGELQNPSSIKTVRREIAQILTVLNTPQAADKEEVK